MKKYNVTFTVNDKYHGYTRTVMVESKDKNHAELLVHDHFGSFTIAYQDIDMGGFTKKVKFEVPSKKITIDKVKEVKEEKVK